MNQNNLSVIINDINKEHFASAEKKLLNLINSDPNNLSLKNILSIVFAKQKKYDQGIKILQNIINLNNNFYDAYINLGNIYSDMNILEKSIDYYKQAIEIDKKKLSAYINLTNLLNTNEKFIEANLYYEKASKLNLKNLDLLNGYAYNLLKLSKYPDSKKILLIILKEHPKNITAMINLSNVERELKNISSAKNILNKIIDYDDKIPEIYYNLGQIDEIEHNIENAKKNYTLAIKFNPKYSESYYNLGCIYEQLGFSDLAKYNFELALKFKPNYKKAFYNLSLNHLSNFNFSEGWEGYERRFGGTLETYKKLRIEKNQIWGGEKFNGTLIVHSEQGIGDEILFSSILKDLKNDFSNLIVTVDDRLIDIMKRSMPNIQFLSRFQEIQVDPTKTKHILLTSLGKIFRKKTDDFKSNQNPWLLASNQKVKEISKLINKTKKIKVGLSWKGASQGELKRHIDITQFAEIFPSEKFLLINLQHGDIEEEKQKLFKDKNHKLFCIDKFDYRNDLEGIAGIINNCDLVASLGNTTAHFSSALGKKTYVLVAPNALWYWQSESKKSLWYPNSTVIRSEKINDWLGPLKNLKEIISKL